MSRSPAGTSSAGANRAGSGQVLLKNPVAELVEELGEMAERALSIGADFDGTERLREWVRRMFPSLETYAGYARDRTEEREREAG